MRKKLEFVVCASLLLSAVSPAFGGSRGAPVVAEEAPVPVAMAPAAEDTAPPSGYWYAGVGGIFAFAIENFHCDVDDAWGYQVTGGRRINDMFAVEAEWEHPVSDYDDAGIVDGYGRANGDFEVWSVTANAKFYPVTGRAQPYALVGAGYGEADLPHDDNGGFVARFGVGLDVLITDRFGVSTGVDYLLGTGSMSDYDQIPVNLGFFYNFS